MAVAKRNVIGLTRQPTTVVFSTVQPIIFVIMFTTYLPQPLTARFLENVRHLSLQSIGLLGSVNGLGNAIFNLFLGQFSSRLGLVLVQALLDAVVAYLPSPIDKGTIVGRDLDDDARRLLEEDLVRLANGLDKGDKAGLARVMRSKSLQVLNRVLNLETGSLAVEAALKMARQYFVETGEPERSVFIARRQSYHGNTLGALAVIGIVPFLLPPLAIAIVTAALVVGGVLLTANQRHLSAPPVGQQLFMAVSILAFGCALLADNQAAARQLAQSWAELFPNRFYIELQRTGAPVMREKSAAV